MSKKLKKGAYFSDIHFGKKANSIQHNEDCLNFIKWFCNQVVENQCDYVAFLGDWNENRSALNIHTLSYAFQGAKLLDRLGLPVYFVIGNHDLYYRNSRTVHSVIHHTEFNNFTVIDKPIIINDIHDGVLFCPYLFHEEYKDLIQSKYLNVPFWAGHFEFKGFLVTGYGITMPTGPDANDFKGPKHIVSGHFHKRQTRPDSNVIYMGNTFPMDFGDAGDNERGMMIYDHESDDMIFINWDDCPKYVKTNLSDLVETKNRREQILIRGARVKCNVDIPIDFDESNYLKQKFSEQYDLREFIMEESPEIRSALSETETNIDWNSDEIQGVNDLVLRMLNMINSDHIDNELLISLYQDIDKADK